MKHKIKRYAAEFGFHSLRFKIFIICMVITYAMVFINSAAITQRAAKVIAENAYDYIFESMRHADSNFDIFLEDALSLSMSISSNRDIVIGALLDHSEAASYDAYAKQRQVEDYLENLATDKNHIKLAAVIGVDGKGYKSSGTLILRSIVEEPWFTQMQTESRVRVFYHTPKERRIALCRPIKYNGRLLGIALVEMDYEILNSVYTITPLQNVKVNTFTEDGGLVFSNFDDQNGSPLPDSLFQEIMTGYDERQNTYEINGVKMLVAKYSSELSGLTTIGLVSYDDLLTEALQMRRQSAPILLLTLIAATLAVWLFARYICQNIQRLQNSMLKITAGDLDSRAHISSQDEIGVMAGIFNQMMDRIARLMHDIKDKEAQKRKAEQDALETQIQPHFIYNTINSIAYVSHMRGEAEIEEVSLAAVELLRGVLSVRESFIPLWQECEYIEQYLKIQKFKMQKDFQVLWEVDTELWLYRIPKLLLQPLVENALIHGINDREGGQINVQITRQEQKVFMRVTDNGRGIGSDALRQMNQSGKQYSQFRTVGFANVKERVRLIYGDGFDVTITSVPEVFTSVEVVLPYPVPKEPEDAQEEMLAEEAKGET